MLQFKMILIMRFVLKSKFILWVLDLDRNVGWFYLGDAFYAFTYYFIEFILYVFLCLSDRDHALAGCQRVTTYNIEFLWFKI